MDTPESPLDAPHVDAPPPIEHNEIVALESTWPRNLGVFAIVYAILGLTCMGIGLAWVIAMPYIPEMFGGGSATPPIVQVTQLVTMALGTIAGLLLLRAGTQLIKRRRAGISLMKTWVVFRLVVIFIGVVCFVVTIPAQVQMAKSRYESINRRMVENNQPEIDMPDDNALLQQSMIGLVAGAVLPSIAPLIVGVFISRRKITQEVREWP